MTPWLTVYLPRKPFPVRPLLSESATIRKQSRQGGGLPGCFIFGAQTVNAGCFRPYRRDAPGVCICWRRKERPPITGVRSSLQESSPYGKHSVRAFCFPRTQAKMGFPPRPRGIPPPSRSYRIPDKLRLVVCMASLFVWGQGVHGWEGKACFLKGSAGCPR